MLSLPYSEGVLLLMLMLTCAFSSILAAAQLLRPGDKFRILIVTLMALAISLGSVILIFRAAAIKAIPLTSLFDSVLVLSIAFGLTFLFLCTAIRQVWFSSVMVWSTSLIVFLSAFTAEPSSEIQEAAKTPWVIFHGLSMIFSGAAIIFSACAAALFLIARRNLKRKKIGRVIGKMPNIEKLKTLNVVGLKSVFVFLSFGLISGAGLAMVKSADISLSFRDWITDSKFIVILLAWVILTVILSLRKFLRERGIAVMTLVACFLILFAIIGSTIFCKSDHNFSVYKPEAVNSEEVVK